MVCMKLDESATQMLADKCFWHFPLTKSNPNCQLQQKKGSGREEKMRFLLMHTEAVILG